VHDLVADERELAGEVEHGDGPEGGFGGGIGHLGNGISKDIWRELDIGMGYTYCGGV
jgi:hypothetical protein